MKVFSKLLVSTLVISWAYEASATLRTDLEDRKKEEVYKKAVDLKIQPYSKVTGQIFVVEGEKITNCVSAIALSPSHVLSVGHLGDSLSNNKKSYIFSTMKKGCLVKDILLMAFGKKEVPQDAYVSIAFDLTVHPTYKNHFFNLSNTNSEMVGTLNFNDLFSQFQKNLNESSFLNPQSYSENSDLETYISKKEMRGADLSILKLRSPLNEKEFPKIGNFKDRLDSKIRGLSVGYGAVEYNDPNGNSQKIHDKLISECHLVTLPIQDVQFNKKLNENLILSTFYSKSSCLSQVLPQSFVVQDTPDQGYNEFCKNNKMMGMPVSGDSGGPLYKGQELVGVYSAAVTGKKTNNSLIEIHHVWTDVRYYVDWIKEIVTPNKGGLKLKKNTSGKKNSSSSFDHKKMFSSNEPEEKK